MFNADTTANKPKKDWAEFCSPAFLLIGALVIAIGLGKALDSTNTIQAITIGFGFIFSAGYLKFNEEMDSLRRELKELKEGEE